MSLIHYKKIFNCGYSLSDVYNYLPQIFHACQIWKPPITGPSQLWKLYFKVWVRCNNPHKTYLWCPLFFMKRYSTIVIAYQRFTSALSKYFMPARSENPITGPSCTLKYEIEVIVHPKDNCDVLNSLWEDIQLCMAIAYHQSTFFHWLLHCLPDLKIPITGPSNV